MRLPGRGAAGGAMHVRLCSVRAVVIVSLTATLAGRPYVIRAQPGDGSGASLESDQEYARLVGSALVAYQEGRFRDARAWFERAHERWPSARTFWGLGVTAFELGRHAQSIVELREALQDARMPLDAAQRAKALDIIGRAERYVGYVRVEVAPKDARIWLDGAQTRERELTLAPGDYTLSARAPNFREVQQQVSVAAGQTRVVKLSLTPLDLDVHDAVVESSPITRQAPGRDDEGGGVLTTWWFWTAVGVAVAGGVTAVLLANAGSGDPGFPVSERIGIGMKR